MKNLLKLGNALTKAEQKNVFGGRPPGGGCTDSNIDCSGVGNSACPPGQGCFIQSPFSDLALCKCL